MRCLVDMVIALLLIPAAAATLGVSPPLIELDSHSASSFVVINPSDEEIAFEVLPDSIDLRVRPRFSSILPRSVEKIEVAGSNHDAQGNIIIQEVTGIDEGVRLITGSVVKVGENIGAMKIFSNVKEEKEDEAPQAGHHVVRKKVGSRRSLDALPITAIVIGLILATALALKLR
ncbi:MAG: hypothetical protein ABIC95_06205 [archaeon]